MRAEIHRILWKRLPRRIRRSGLFSLTKFLASMPDPEAKPAEPIIVVGCLRSATGLGESARLCYETLRAAGIDVRGIDISSVVMQPRDVSDFEFRDAGMVRGRGTLLIHVNAPLLPLVFLRLGRRVIREKFVVGYWAWELPAIPIEWNIGIPFVHEVWVPSRFVAAAIAASAPHLPIHVLPHAVARSDHWPIATRSRTYRRFTALNIFDMGSSMARKNPIGAIMAFQHAFGDHKDCHMIVKVMHSDLFPAGMAQIKDALSRARNISLIDRTLRRSELSELYSTSNCLISLHRAEGFGLTIAEAMLHGIPALATDWSGTTDFLTEDTGCPIRYQLIPARDPQRIYDYSDLCWAEPDIAAATEALQRIRDEPFGLGDRARDHALRYFNAKSYTSTALRYLKLEG